LLLGLFQLVLPRRSAFLPVIIAGCYMTLGQALVVWGLDFHLMRILILFGVVRVIVRRELSDIQLTPIDGVLATWLLVSTFLYVLFDGTHVSLIGRLGDAYNAAGLYLLVRASVRTLDDAVFVTRLCAIVIVPLSVLFILEGVTGRNPFAVLGGVSMFSEVRNGRVRAQGPFLHSILAGTFGATAWPVFAGLWVYGKGNRLLATFAILAAIVIVVASGSSGPLMALVVSALALICWVCRKLTRPMRWGLVLGIFSLHLVMNAPVWFLITRISDVTGGGGWYRAALIDAAVNHFDEWWLIGTGFTAHWMPTGILADKNSADIVNEFIAQGVKGGLISLLLFVWLIVMCFKTVGNAMRITPDDSWRQRFLIWSMGCALVAHIASFFSVSYFDQITIYWYLLIGMIAALIQQTKRVCVEQSLVDVRTVPNAESRFAHFRPRPAAVSKKKWAARGNATNVMQVRSR
jgi:hypothetical protein